MESTWIQGIFVFSLTIYFVAQFILQMKQVVLTLFFLLSVFHCSAQEKLLSLDGTFQNNNLVVYNPPQSDGFGFCVTKVLVNGEILPAAIQSAHFEINFQLFQLKLGENVFVVLECTWLPASIYESGNSITKKYFPMHVDKCGQNRHDKLDNCRRDWFFGFHH
jgi:hypothetical protein